MSLWEQLRQPNNTVLESLRDNPDVKNINLTDEVLQAVIIDAKYEGYLAKQERLVAGLKTLEAKKIPPDLDYNSVAHLRAEAKEKLSAFRPGTLAQAARISGITPADITVIQIHLKRKSF
jgi:tRNA uridine 5-carboxymethylaminomethyl modification enzyme